MGSLYLPKGSSQPRDWTQVSCIAGGFFANWATREALTHLDSILKSRHYIADKGLSSQSRGFSSSRVWMWELDHKESWVPKNWCFWTVVLSKTLESPLVCKEIQSILKEISLNIHWKDWCCSWNSYTLATWSKELTHWKRPWCWERL